MTDFDKYIKENLSDPVIKSEYDALGYTKRYFNVLHSVHKLDYTVPECPSVQLCAVMKPTLAILYAK